MFSSCNLLIFGFWQILQIAISFEDGEVLVVVFVVLVLVLVVLGVVLVVIEVVASHYCYLY